MQELKVVETSDGCGWGVEDASGQVWHPRPGAAAEAAKTDAQRIALCERQPMLGCWHC